MICDILAFWVFLFFYFFILFLEHWSSSHDSSEPLGPPFDFVWFNLSVSSIFFGVFLSYIPFLGGLGLAGVLVLITLFFSALSRGMPVDEICVLTTY